MAKKCPYTARIACVIFLGIECILSKYAYKCDYMIYVIYVNILIICIFC